MAQRILSHSWVDTLRIECPEDFDRPITDCQLTSKGHKRHGGSTPCWHEAGERRVWRYLLLDEVEKQQQQQQHIDAYEEMDLQVRTEPPPPY